jgi:very-short-patch-repair endonuclease
MQKQDIYKYLCENSQRLFNRKGGILNIKNHEIYKEINYDFKNAEDLYDYLNTYENKICRYEKCNNKKAFRTFKSGYKDFCSIECNNKWLSESRIGEGNPIHRISDKNRIKWKKTLSRQVKERIKSGNWTPEVTNSWCHSRYKIKFKRSNKEITQNVRSSWEAFYQLMNPDYLYEKLRIPYELNGEWHNYIVDFINNDKKIVVEVKPKSEELNQKNIIKRNALIKWCNDNQYGYKIINEDFFKQQKWDDQLIKNQPDEKRLSKFKNYFLNEN